MPLFKKIPITIQAVQFINKPAVDLTEEEIEFIREAVCFKDCLATGWKLPHVHTLEGSSYELPEGYWVIKGIKGEYYPCDPDVFKKTYEPVID